MSPFGDGRPAEGAGEGAAALERASLKEKGRRLVAEAGGLSGLGLRVLWARTVSMPAARLYLDHPAFFVHDANGDFAPDDIPQLEPQEPPLVWRTRTVLAIGTIAAVDGEVEVKLDHGPELQGILAFVGSLPTPSGALAVTQSSSEEILRLNGLGASMKIQVGVDDLHYPRRVHLVVS